MATTRRIDDEDDDLRGVPRNPVAERARQERARAAQYAEQKEELESALLTNYGIQRGATLKSKVSTLYLTYGFAADEIAETLLEPIDAVFVEVEKIDKRIASAGKPLTDAEKTHERGKMILTLAQTLESLRKKFSTSQDEKIAGHIDRISQRLAGLQGLGDVLPEEGQSVTFGNQLEAAIAKLNAEELSALRARLS